MCFITRCGHLHSQLPFPDTVRVTPLVRRQGCTRACRQVARLFHRRLRRRFGLMGKGLGSGNAES